MTTNDKDFTVDKIKQEYKFIEDSNFYKIYNEFNWDCSHSKYKDYYASCLYNSSDAWTDSVEVTMLLEKLYSNLYRVYATNGGNNNDYFENNHEEVNEIGCIYLKYWLYDKILKSDFDDSEIEKLFQGLNNYVQKEVRVKPNNPCTFYSLKKDEIKKMIKLYALNIILHTSDKILDTCNVNECKYMDYFEEVLIEFMNSINNCSINPSSNNYCSEFEEFLNVCKDGNQYTGISINSEYKDHSTDPSKKYLSFEKYKGNPLYIYIKNKKWLEFDKIAHLLHTENSTTTTATSVVGSAIGVSSIFYYLYRFTPFGKTLRKGKGENIVNIDEEEHNDLLYTEDTEQTPFKKRDYHIAYHTFSDT
ncbi:Plasmodium vivax Vir protein, putative [Plasmodium vivax]|nr:Plasmodium vivax Vir protein, putative [Plasmodium vivax]